MGKWGRGFASLNLMWFGYLGYIYLLLLIYPAYGIYKDSKISKTRLKNCIAIVLLSLGILMLQYIALQKGELGKIITESIFVYFGTFGIWLNIILCVFIGLFLLFPRSMIYLKTKIYTLTLKLFGYLKENFIQAYLYLKPITLQYYHALKTKLRSFFAYLSANPKSTHSLNAPLKAPFSQSQKDRGDTFLSDTTSQNPNNTSSAPNPQTQNPHNFDEKNIIITYTDTQQHLQNLINQEKKYANMVRLVGKDENGEVLDVDLNLLKQRLKKHEESTQELDSAPSHAFTKLSPTSSSLEDSHMLDSHATDLHAMDSYAIDSHLAESKTAESSATKSSTQSIMEPLIVDSHISKNPESNSLEKRQIEEEQNAIFNPHISQISQKQNTQEITHILDSSAQSQAPQILQQSSQNLQNPQDLQSSQKVAKVAIIKELDETNMLLQSLEQGSLEQPKNYILPPLSLLQEAQPQKLNFEEGEIDTKIQNLLTKLKVFKIDGDVVRIYSGPVVTTFEFRPAPNVKVSRISGLSDDLAMALCASSIRIQAPIPGKDVIGIEVPNSESQTIYLREILESEVFQNSSSPLALGLGKDIVGNPFVTDLKKLPHLLIAGTTGSGKSVGVNAMILSLLYRNSPDNLKLIMIDPKKVEFSLYEEIPHLLTPIITDSKKAIIALGNVAKEMERRYEIMKEMKTKTIDNYNAKAKEEDKEILPFIVVIIDELADLMMTGGKDAESSIIRIAQMGRAAGLHLIVATQRPSVDVVTGLIKTNLPAKIAFKVGSRTDSRVILDTEGAQNLLGRGDMLFSLGGGSNILRLHAPWTSEEEIEKIVEFIRSQREVSYDSSFLADDAQTRLQESDFELSDSGSLLDEAKKMMLMDGKTSISNLQRRLGIGYNKAASIVEELERQGFLSAPNSKGIREIIG
ncbi:DNA translocase FtsK [Helicobacter fennelliae]|uniref:DNA translocase FtsK n=1 Tax=Helicobacter fennelliae TaxID=215 RepID=UPI000E02C269|nr:DNA translocase FtsK [Helicobacter fennelliae]STQ84115.1 cell division protein [Helicobacter fennelliae]